MRKIILICDRCGKQYKPWETKGKELYGVAEIDYSDFEPILDMKMDLCEPCYISLEEWFKNEGDSYVNFADDLIPIISNEESEGD